MTKNEKRFTCDKKKFCIKILLKTPKFQNKPSALHHKELLYCTVYTRLLVENITYVHIPVAFPLPDLHNCIVHNCTYLVSCHSIWGSNPIISLPYNDNSAGGLTVDRLCSSPLSNNELSLYSGQRKINILILILKHMNFFLFGGAMSQLFDLTDEEYFLRQGRRDVGGEEVWAEPECPALAPALVSPGQEDEALLSCALVSRYEEFLVKLGESSQILKRKKIIFLCQSCNLFTPWP
jgi:hypothetical protein